ncbi:transporter substrate-binding domain-containing protein [Bisbaumannia pacifica]|uniref:ABC transporter substrate-binding protein n=1 Tax=Bisbaumannia pacifica TaxID=77098 RepID=A0A510XA49_9GAMM|nr:transporter substrate-binding domain-containing protein [Halomonas pacifica]MBH8580143.1 transporter substrate-binding domain-containing protein [Halomonas pacifica]GEK48284.1 ABC transporter substrate-binding protein [Halomonas pacifica]
MRASLFSGLLIATALSTSPAIADESPLRIGVDVPYVPYQYQQPDGTITGFEVELINAVCTEMQRECEWIKQDWDGIIPGLLARKYDFIASAMNITEDRARQVQFSEPYYQVPSVWVGRSDHEVDVEDTLAGVTIGVQQGTIQDRYVTQFHPEADIRRYSNSGGVISDMHSGRLDLVFTAFPLAQEALLDEDAYSRRGPLITEPESIYGPGVGAAFRTRDQELVEEFNAAMAEVKADGTFERLQQQYFGE